MTDEKYLLNSLLWITKRSPGEIHEPFGSWQAGAFWWKKYMKEQEGQERRGGGKGLDFFCTKVYVKILGNSDA